MRVAVVTTSYPSHPDDPSGHFVRAEVRALIEAGHEVVLLAPVSTPGDAERGLTRVALPHFGLFGWPGALATLRSRPWKLLGVVPFTASARRCLTRLGIVDQLICHWLLPSFWPVARDYAEAAQVVCHGSDVRLLEHLPRQVQRLVISSLCRPNVAVRCVSSELASRLRRLATHHGLRPFPVTIAPAALDLPTLEPRVQLRRKLGLDAKPVIAIVGRIVAEKRVDVALAAIRAASTNGDLAPRPDVLVIGNGPERSRLMRQYPEAKWLGQLGRTRTLEYVAAADLLVSASLLEGAPTAVREARALGTRVVAAASGDLALWASTDPGLRVTDKFEAPPHPEASIAIALIRAELKAQW